MSEDLKKKFEEVEELVQKVLWQNLDLVDFFERLAEICDEIEALETLPLDKVS